MKQEWLMPGAVVPVDMETTAALVAEIKRALNQRREWQGLTDEERDDIILNSTSKNKAVAKTEAKLKEKNT